MKEKIIRIGMCGAGYFGSLHAQNLKNTNFDFVGFYDPDDENSKIFQEKFQVKRYQSVDLLMDACDAVDIVSPTIFHMDLATKAVEKGKHIFIEKPIADSADSAKEFLKALKEKDLVVQVGHIERFNPAFHNGMAICQNPKYIESKRLAGYNPRANDVSVIHDLMIHDIDAILSLVKSKVKNIYASGYSVLTKHLDICEARLEFENGSTANLQASRMHMEQERSLSIYGENNIVHIDFLNKKYEAFALDQEGKYNLDGQVVWETPKGKFLLQKNVLNFPASNAILEELTEFYYSIVNDEPIRVDQNDAFQALLIADKIQQIAN